MKYSNKKMVHLGAVLPLVLFLLPSFLPAEAAAGNVRSLLSECARSYLGVPYVLGGTTADGVDCSGLTYRVYQDVLGKTLPRIVINLYNAGEGISTSDLLPGDLVFFDTTGGVSHVGLYVGGGDFIHAASEGSIIGVKTSNLSQQYYSVRYVGARRYYQDRESARDGRDTGGNRFIRGDPADYSGYYATTYGHMILLPTDGYGNFQGSFSRKGREGNIWGKIDPENGRISARWVLPGKYSSAGESGEAVFIYSEKSGMFNGKWRLNGEAAWSEDWDARHE